MNKVKEIARNVLRIPVKIGNCYMVGTQEEWFMLDTGTEGNANRIKRIAESRFGPYARPRAIFLTHGHFDHAGSAGALADEWEVPIFAHRLEVPYLTGKSNYPPPDPTVGGFMANMIRFVPNHAFDYGNRVHELPKGRQPDGMLGWSVIETPGHSPGHVSFFRDADRTLLVGDAFATVDQTSAIAVLTMRPEVSLPPTYYTCDWDATYESVASLADLEPEVIGAGHGEPMFGDDARQGLHRLVREWPAPRHGRYVNQPARADESGVVYLPPPAPDPVKWITLGVAAAGTVGAAAYWARKHAA